MKFWLGTHMTSWLATVTVPLFVSRVRLERHKRLPVAATEWALDSGGFTELDRHGGWALAAKSYAALVRRYADEVGMLAWAAPQDWMCEPWLVAKTGLSVGEHQRRTTGNFLELRAYDLPIIPVLQGWTLADYHRHADQYAVAGIDLTVEPLVGLGSVCRRQATDEIHQIVASLADRDLALHGFGAKTSGLARYGGLLASADSMAWSYAARKRQIKLDGCTHRGFCGNCARWALRWREREALRDVGERDLQLAFAGEQPNR